MTSNRFVVLDRDGTIIRERNYLADPDGVELLPGAGAALLRLRMLGFGLIVVTNQSGVARGYFDQDRLNEIHDRMRALLAVEGAELDDIDYCPHRPEDACGCRKPATGMIERASRRLGFDPARCIVIGDSVCDIELGRAIGATTILVRTGYGAAVEGSASADHVVDDLPAAADLIASIQPELASPAVGNKS
jgi:D-glycero-D-manno-heptose 1,7-bisphosphate phosphatase